MAIQTQHVDLAVAEVFELMMGVPCRPAASVESEAEVTAVIGLAGSLSGACILKMREPVALKLAELMVGAPMAGFDRIVKDALGEACNLLAGTWKGRQTNIASTCMLSVPAVISGSNYEFHMPMPAFRLERTYAFEGHRFTFLISCVGL
jgi:chemotaxis protein CheX